MLGRHVAAWASAFCLSQFLLAGCRPPTPLPSATPAATDVRAGYVRVERYVALHPAAAQLQALDRQMARLQREAAPVHLKSPDAPVAVDLPEPAVGGMPADPVYTPDYERARGTIQEEYAIRAEAEPDLADRRYRIELARLRRRFLEARLDLPEVAGSGEDLAEVRERAEAMSRLEQRIRELEERPERRALHTADELRKRRNERDEARRQLEELREAELARLRSALELPRRQPARRVEIPAAELARVERERSEARSAAQMSLMQEEREALARVQERQLPSPPAADNAVEPAPEPVPSPELVAGAERYSPPFPPLFQGNARALEALSLKRKSLYQAILRDLRVAARDAARTEGIELQAERAGLPNRTAELQPAVRRILSARPLSEGVE